MPVRLAPHLLNLFFSRALQLPIRLVAESNHLLQVASRIKKANFFRWKSSSGQARTTVQVWTVEEGFGIGNEFR